MDDMTIRRPPLHDRNLTLACGYGDPAHACGAPAAWHLSWYEDGTPSFDWPNSLACEEHAEEAKRRWDVGWRHRVLPACGMPGALLHIAEQGSEENVPVSYCHHPFDGERQAVQAAEPIAAV